MSNPKVAKQLETFVIDKEALLNLRKDVLTNPDKYEKLFRRDNGTFYAGAKMSMELKQERIDEYDYWYRVLNEGRLQEDSFPWMKEHLAYKEWMLTVEGKALGTLRRAVQKLLNEYETTENLKEYGQLKGETKNEALQRLIAVVNEAEPVIETKKGKGKKKEESSLTQKTRSTSEIKQHVNRLMESDPQISKLLPSKEISTENTLINNLKQNLMNELYSLVEFVLLNNNPSKASHQVLSKQ